MSAQESPYDPYIPSGQTGTQQAGGAGANSRRDYSGLQNQIEETKEHMKKNVQAVSQRGERLDALQDKTDNLAVSAQGFRRGANRVRKQMWWKDMKMRMCIIIGVIVLLAIIIIPIWSRNGTVGKSMFFDVLNLSGVLALPTQSRKETGGKDPGHAAKQCFLFCFEYCGIN
ncbi:hypothetical protein LLEC1_04050 [Akanthomyces lecanii]|uniref:V-SNARE coiled-coil homology domain-containing protein n=1 Tax=Cordyceps confragosa TaxID=2714763 RepID=A0A179IME3_CORDF|nr:hypothetical protein LLEC1_04050 [Akanthomyces lecanii]